MPERIGYWADVRASTNVAGVGARSCKCAGVHRAELHHDHVATLAERDRVSAEVTDHEVRVPGELISGARHRGGSEAFGSFGPWAWWPAEN